MVKSAYAVGGTNTVPRAVVELVTKEKSLLATSNGTDESRAIMSSIDSITGLKPELWAVKTRGFVDCTEVYIVVKHRGLEYAATAAKQTIAVSVAEAYIETINRIVRQVEYDEKMRLRPEQEVAFHTQPVNGGDRRDVLIRTQAPSYLELDTFYGVISGWYLKLPDRFVNDPKHPNVAIRSHRHQTKEGLVGTSIGISARTPKTFEPRERNLIHFGKRQMIRDPFAIELSDVVREAVFESTKNQ